MGDYEHSPTATRCSLDKLVAAATHRGRSGPDKQGTTTLLPTNQNKHIERACKIHAACPCMRVVFACTHNLCRRHTVTSPSSPPPATIPASSITINLYLKKKKKFTQKKKKKKKKKKS